MHSAEGDAMLSEQQIDFFNANGFVIAENAVSPAQLQSLRDDFAGWVTDSKAHETGWGETINGKARFDLEPGHCAARPALRRVNAPHEVSQSYFEVMADSRMTDMVAALIGPDVKLHRTKIIGSNPACVAQPLRQLDLAAADICSIIWATGYRQDFGWLQVDALDADGRPRHQNGIAAELGIYFLGLPWLTMRGSSFIWGVWEDAAMLAAHIFKRNGVPR
jgi:hypothetical protein